MLESQKSDLHHNSDDRDITNSLVNISDFSKYVNWNSRNYLSTQNVSDWSEAIVGWRPATSLGIFTSKSSNPGTTLKKKRILDRSVTDLQYGNQGSQYDDYWCNNKHQSRVKCVTDEVETFPIPPWKSNIEQGTYRYIPDNGSYRTHKFMYDERKEWYTIRKKYPEKVSSAWHQNCKRLQREMRRQLKKELSKSEKENSASHSIRENSAWKSIDAYSSGGETSRSSYVSKNVIEKTPPPTTRPPPQSEPPSQTNKEKQTIQPYQTPETRVAFHHFQDTLSRTGQDLGASNLEPSAKSVYRRESRVKSTHSDGALSQVRKMKTIHERESEPPTPMPNYSIPSGSQMLKSASDLFIENFSTRITALEDEIKKDAKWLRKNENESTKLQNSRARYREHTRPNFRESGSSSVTPRLPQKTETLTTDIFSVKPVVHKELKPLEKTRIYVKQNTSNHQQGETNNAHPAFQNRNNFNNYFTSHNYNSDFEMVLSGYNTQADSSKQALCNTLTGTKINTHNNKKISKGFSAPSTITICDNVRNSSIDSPRNETDTEPFKHVALLDKKPEKKDSLQNIPAFLPEISGKRLQVNSISHRLL
ncbi:uncharacterized protein LOC128244636 [Mya arenaria]|uniref:uncharacterized protein LOC128244636 n=1 Tax=Mya arenaria TaxID=6604 RepID=UPI0022E691EF|nr:uncharacterized protein LOC128244636 [Mya arenaria]